MRVCSASCKHNTDAHTGIRITVLPAVSQVAVAQSSGTPNASSEHSAICSLHPHTFPRVILTILFDPIPALTTCRPYQAPTQNSSIVWFKWNRHPVANYGVFDLSPIPPVLVVQYVPFRLRQHFATLSWNWCIFKRYFRFLRFCMFPIYD